ncbi:MAG: hypothetical protein HFF76_02990 [Oscillospiraceae bacterium]|jgi:hypothetical protein|nr:hypothetical protein [Oscillospiraceae bacterium]
MKDIHKKLYAILMGDVSETITFMEDLILHEKYSKEDMMEAILMLRAALEKVEEMHIKNEEDNGQTHPDP